MKVVYLILGENTEIEFVCNNITTLKNIYEALVALDKIKSISINERKAIQFPSWQDVLNAW